MTSVVPHGYHQWRDRVLTFASKARAADAARSENILLMCDELNAGAERYGEMYAQVLDETGFGNSQTLDNCLSTAKAIPVEKRRFDSLSLAHHHAVAPLRKNPEQIDAVLDVAQAAGWTANETRDRVKGAKANIPNALHPDVPREEITGLLLSKVGEPQNPIIKAYDAADLATREEFRTACRLVPLPSHYPESKSHVEHSAPKAAPCDATSGVGESAAGGTPTVTRNFRATASSCPDDTPSPEHETPADPLVSGNPDTGGGTSSDDPLEIPDFLKRTVEAV